MNLYYYVVRIWTIVVFSTDDHNFSLFASNTLEIVYHLFPWHFSFDDFGASD